MTPQSREPKIRSAVIGLSAFILFGCKQLEPPTVTIDEAAIKDLEASLVSHLEAYKTALAEAQTDPANAMTASKLFARGVAVNDIKCTLYFNRLGIVEQRLDFTRRELGLVGGATSAILGIAEAAASTVAITGTAFGFGVASLDEAESAFVFSPEVASVETLVDNSQSAFLTEASSNPPQSYDHALVLIADYDKLCQIHSIRRLVNESLVSADPIPISTGGKQAFDTATTELERALLARSVGESFLSNDEIFYIYWLFLGTPTADERSSILQRLSNLEGVVKDGAVNPALDIDEVRQALAPIARRLGASFAERIAAERGAPVVGAGAQQAPTAFGSGITIRIQ